MKKKIVLLVATLVLLSGCGKKIPKLDNGQEAVATFEDGSMISINELYEEMRNNYATSILIRLVDTKLLETEYKDKVEGAEAYAKGQVEAMKLYYKDEDGNYSESKFIDAIQQNYGFTSIEEFEESIKLDKLREYAVDDYVKGTIKDKDIKKYYKDEFKADREVLHILISSNATSADSEEDKKTKESEALNKAKEVIAKLKKGEKFEDLAKEYSSDEATKENGGSLGYINKEYYGSEKFDEELYSLKVGSYSTTPVKTTKGYEILYIKDEKEKKSLEDAKEEIINALVEDKIEKDGSLNVTGMMEFRKSHGFEIVDTEVDRSYERYMERLIANAKEDK